MALLALLKHVVFDWHWRHLGPRRHRRALRLLRALRIAREARARQRAARPAFDLETCLREFEDSLARRSGSVGKGGGDAPQPSEA
jgi:hypothetical protein